MRFRGGGAGHKASRDAADSNLDDLDALDEQWKAKKKAKKPEEEERDEEDTMDVDLPAEPDIIDLDVTTDEAMATVEEEVVGSDAENEIDSVARSGPVRFFVQIGGQP